MIKASKIFCLIFLVATASGLQAQTATDVNLASDEAIHRQEETIRLRRTLVEAQSARQRGDILGAHKLYERCYQFVQDIGPGGIEPEAQQTIIGLSDVLIILAHEDQKHQDYKAADEKFARILVVDPKNQAAIQGRQDNSRRLQAQAGTIPSQETIQRIPEFRKEQVNVGTLVHDGKLLYEAGHFDEAEVKLKQAYALDPGSVAAFQYLQAIQQRRLADANRKTELASVASLEHVQKEWIRDRSNGELTPRPNMFNRTNLIYTSERRQVLTSKLDRIRIDSVKYDDLPLTEVINNLSELARQRDPDKLGINFYVDRQAPAAPAAAAGAIDPATGLPVAPLPTDQADISSVTVKISPALTDVKLSDVLDAITKTASKPIRYSVLDYAIVFSLKGQEPTPLETRTFHVDPNTFRMGLESVSGLAFGNIQTGNGGSSGGGGNSGGAGGQGTTTAVLPSVDVTSGTSSFGGGGNGGGGGGGGAGRGLNYVTSSSNYTAVLQTQVRNFFIAVGVDLNTNNPANVGKMFVWNDRKGILLVRSTAQDLDMIDAAIQALNQAPPEVNIKAKFIEITQDDNRGLGFNWYLGNFKLGSGAVASGGTQPSLNGVQNVNGGSVNPEGTFPGSALYGTAIAPGASDGLITGGLRNTVGQNGTLPTIGTLTGILTDPQFRVAINALEQRDGVDELNAPEVTTESGRQAQIQAVDVQTIVTGTDVQANTGGSVTGVQGGTASPIVQSVPTANYTTSALPFGPTLDVIPYVSADGFSVQMVLIPTITEFLQYDDPGQFVPAALVSGQTGNASLTAVLPLPHFRMRQVTTSVTVWDAQTVVIGGLMTDSVTKIKDSVPLLGDLPLVGRLFQSQSSSKTKKNLMIFVTPTIINPDGTRFHSDEEMPFAQNSIPVQPPVNR